MWKGTIFELRGKRYKIQKINSDGVYASKMLDEHKCQKGRPSRFSHIDVATSLNVAVEKLYGPPKPRAPRTIKWAEREEKEAREKVEAEKVEESEEETENSEEDTLTPEEKKAKEEEEKAKAEQRTKIIVKLFALLGDDSTDDDW